MANKKKTLKTWAEIAKSVRHPMPPPTKVDKKLTAYNRKREKKQIIWVDLTGE